MRVHLDVVTLFPAFFDVLDLSLIGRARQAGVVSWSVHDLRENTHDRHRTVDDTPYGGGAGMVMRPEPWGEALENLRPTDGSPVTLVLPTPSGRRFSQADAVAWARQPRLVFGCGRYEGIDARVVAWADRHGSGWTVEEVSLGDYVLNGGEVAVLAIVEAVVRLLPGVVGNAASLAEESHVDGLVEHPVFTKPASWHGLEVPDVLLSGNHAAINRWRRDESLRRTAGQRPDLIASYSPAQCDEGDLALLASMGWRPSGEGFVRVR